MLYPTQLPTPIATHQHHQSKYFAILDEENIVDDETIVVSNEGNATDDATVTTEEWADEEESQDSSPWEEMDLIPEEISLHTTTVTPIIPIVRIAPPTMYVLISG